MRTTWGLLFTFALGGCSEIAGNAGFGATQGGVKDIAYARELVENGRVPPPESFIVEGMFSEHDLPLAGAPCVRTFCPRAAAGLAPVKDGEAPAAWVQVGLASSIDPAHFQRPPLTVIFTVDVSGSMGWEYAGDSEYPTPGALARQLLRGLVPKLDGGDRLAIVAYGSEVSVPLPTTSGAEQGRALAVVEGLATAGSTNMEAGMRRAIELAQAETNAGREVRIMLFTDEQPNVGATTAGEFERMVAGAADQGVGITIFGLGLGLGQAVMNAMSHLRGGNAFSLTRTSQAESLLADEWPWMAVPIAYDLALDVITAQGREVAATYGFPGDGKQASLDVSSIFLSKRRGALLVRLDGSGAELANLRLLYRTPAGDSFEEELSVSSAGLTPDGRSQAWAQSSVGRTVALALLVTGMRDAAQLYATDRAAAKTRLRATVNRFGLDVQSLSADDLAGELDFARDLLALVDKDAPQGGLYGERY
jgi:Ca-activated chloride channel homolog